MTMSGLEKPWVMFTLIALMGIGLNLVISLFLGFFSLYALFPAKPQDPIGMRFRWVQFSRRFGQTQVSVGFGETCLHLREVFPWRMLLWAGPASIPYTSLRILSPSKEGFWSMFSPAEFHIPEAGMAFKLGGKAGRLLEGRLLALQSSPPGGSDRPDFRPF